MGVFGGNYGGNYSRESIAIPNVRAFTLKVDQCVQSKIKSNLCIAGD